MDGLRSSIRALALPYDPGNENKCVHSASQFLLEHDIQAEEHAEWVRLNAEEWWMDGKPPKMFKSLIGKILETGSDEFGRMLAESYFDAHERLRDSDRLSPVEATMLLSQALLIARLARNERMSASEITKVLAARDRRMAVRWKGTRRVLMRMGLKPSLELQQIQELFQFDSKAEESELADATVEEAAEMIGELGERVGLSGAASLLCDLATNDGPKVWPYLEMLHFQCLIAEYYDHPISNIYEFSPRGRIVDWLLAQAPDSLRGAMNPFLNNAKAVQNLDSAWAESRESQLEAARSLAELLRQMEDLSFTARREVAAWIRYWIHRIMRVTAPGSLRVPDTAAEAAVLRVLLRISAQPTQTRGIIEQRVIDAVASARHPVHAGWRPRGLGDSVNTTNISSAKLGDCDFQHPTEKRIIAFESHAGQLGDVYLDAHRRTLRKALALRSKELVGFAEPAEWAIEIVFVAHGFDIRACARWPRELIEGFTINYRYQTLAEFFRNALAGGEAQSITERFARYVHDPLNSATTPEAVRRSYLVLLGE